MYRSLIIEDDPQIAELIAIHIQDLNFDVTIKLDGLEGLKTAISNKFDLIVLDIMLPSIDGIDICRKLRAQENQVPIIMLTAKSEEIDRVIGLETGADDYILKPFSIREFKARVKAIMRRSNADILDITTDKKVRCGNLEIDIEKRIVQLNNERIELTPKEFELLILLACNPGKSFSRQNLLNSVWGYDFAGFQHTVNSHINRLRAKIEEDMAKPKFILTSWGYGYRFNDQV